MVGDQGVELAQHEDRVRRREAWCERLDGLLNVALGDVQVDEDGGDLGNDVVHLGEQAVDLLEGDVAELDDGEVR